MSDDRRLEQALHLMEVEAVNFAYRYTKDANTRQWYIQKTQAMSRELRGQYNAGQITARKAAEAAQEMRNEIMDMARLRTSDIGLARARQLKGKGKSLDDLISKYSTKKFSKPFDALTKGQQDEVLVEIVDAAGRPNPKVNAKVGKMAALGRSLWVLSAAIAIYNVATAEDKTHQAGREVANVAGGFAGGAAAGALAGIWFGPLGVAVGAAVGGIVGSMIADEAYSELTAPKDTRVRAILPRFTGFFSFDESGLATALYDEAGIDMDAVEAVFKELLLDHTGDADSAAWSYLAEVERRGGAPLHALRTHPTIRQTLARSLEAGWWVTDGEKAKAKRVLNGNF